MMESPDETSETACPMVLHAVSGRRQLLVSLPFTPSTYHAVLATAHGARAAKKADDSKPMSINVRFMTCSPLRGLCLKPTMQPVTCLLRKLLPAPESLQPQKLNISCHLLS